MEHASARDPVGRKAQLDGFDTEWVDCALSQPTILLVVLKSALGIALAANHLSQPTTL